VGNNSERPAASAGYFRFNSDSGTVEFYNGTSWIPFQNSISDQQIDPSIQGVSQTYALTQVAATEGLLVSINGVVQRPGTAYNVTNYPGTTVANVLTLYESVSVNDVIDVRYIASATSVTLTGLGEDISTTGNIVGNVIQGNILNVLNFNGNLTGNVTGNVVGNLTGNVQASTVYANATVVTSSNITVGTANVIIDSFDAAQYRAARYTVSSTNIYDSQLAEVHLTQMGTKAVVSVFGLVNTGANTISFGANVSGVTVNLLAIGTTALNQLRIQRTYFGV
jgi:hypothetical protein